MSRGGSREGAVLLYAEENIKELKSKIPSRRRKVMQKAIATSLTKTRIRAEEYILPNPTGDYNPYFASKKMQKAGIAPVVPGRLRSKTGKLKLMLKNKASASNPLKGWTNFGNKIARQPSNALHSMVRANKDSSFYTGTISVWLKGGDSRLFETARGQPQESLKTLAVRFNWETGIRGERRPIFEPVTKKADFDFRRLVEEGNATVWRLH